jgi:hypothetical protein
MTTKDRQAHWRTIIDNQAASGMNIATYCRESHIHSSLFYTWRRKLRALQPFAGGFLELIPGRLTESVASGIRSKLAPVVPVQQIVGGCQRHITPQSLIQSILYLAYDKNPGLFGFIKKGRKKRFFLFRAHARPASSAS